jgi:hypothetical protein
MLTTTTTPTLQQYYKQPQKELLTSDADLRSQSHVFIIKRGKNACNAWCRSLPIAVVGRMLPTERSPSIGSLTDRLRHRDGISGGLILPAIKRSGNESLAS